MKVLSSTKKSSTVRVLQIEASPDEYRAEEDRIYARLRKKAKLPGFRPGKAPREVLRAHYGKSVEADAIEACIGEALGQALEDQALVPLAESSIRDVQRTSEGGVRFSADVEVLPDLDLPDYTKLEAVREIQEVTDEQVDDRLEEFRRMAAQVRVVDRPAATGDLVRFRYQRLDTSGIPLIGTTVEDNTLVIGEREDLQPFWEAMIGARAGETRDFGVASPPRTGGPAAGGKPPPEVRYKVVVHEVCERELPELDDEFAKDLGRFEGVEELRRHTRSRLEKEAEEYANRGAQEQLLRRIVEKSSVEPVPSLVERYLDSLVAEAREAHQARAEGRPFDEGHIREAHQAEAAAHVAEYVVVRTIAAQEGLEPDDDEVVSYVSALWGRAPDNDELGSMRGRLREMKVKQFLMSKAKTREVRRKPAPKGGRLIKP